MGSSAIIYFFIKMHKTLSQRKQAKINEVRKPVSQMNISFTALHFH